MTSSATVTRLPQGNQLRAQTLSYPQPLLAPSYHCQSDRSWEVCNTLCSVCVISRPYSLDHKPEGSTNFADAVIHLSALTLRNGSTTSLGAGELQKLLGLTSNWTFREFLRYRWSKWFREE